MEFELEQPEGWRLAEPGVMKLEGTKYVIRWTGLGSYFIDWNGGGIGASGNLKGAQEHVTWHSKELQAMGLEP